jgi:hypothetical protein
MRARSAALGGLEQAIDDAGGDAVRRGRKQGCFLRAPHEAVDFIQARELELRIRAAQMRKCGGDRRARLAIRQNGGKLELRMSRDQPQQLAGDVACAAQHDRWRRRAHSPATLDSATLRSGNFEMM